VTDPRVPTGPLERDPAGPFIDREERLALLLEVLDGVELGAHDYHVIDWLAGWDTSTVLTVAGLLARARRATAAAATAELAGLQRRQLGGEGPLVTRPHDWPPGRR
jgi:hypothetical protein